MTTLTNLTPHPIVIATPDGVVELPACRTPPRVREQVAPHTTIRHNDTDIPVVTIVAGEVSGLPAPIHGHWFVVARVIAQAAADRDDLLVPHGLRRDAHGNVLACTALARLQPPQPHR